MESKNKGIVITTSEFTKDYLKPLLDSIGDIKYPITIVKEGWELGGIAKGKELYDEFIFLMDSCFIKDNTLFDKLFDYDGNVFITEGGYHYMGKFVSDNLPDISKVNNKEEAIQWELRWLKAPSMEGALPIHTDVFEEKYGQRRMVLENDYMIKWKGTFYI